MGVLADLADQGLAIARWHPVLWFDLFVRVDALLKRCELFRIVLRGFGFDHLCIHVRFLFASLFGGLDPFDNDCCALTDANTHGAQRVFAA